MPEETDNKIENINYYKYNNNYNKKLINQSQLVIFGAYPPLAPLKYAYLKKKKIITYLWSIAPIGSLEFKDFKNFGKQDKLHKFIIASYNLSLQYSDKIFVRSEKTRDLVLGSLISMGKANLKNYRQKRNFDNLIELAPFGIKQTKPKKKTEKNKNNYTLLWNGGVWNWKDGVNLIKIMELISKKKKNIELIFQGYHNPDKIYSVEAKKTKRLADKLKLTDKNIFFPKEWVSFNERGTYLAQTDAGIVTSPNIPEANYFIKTRFYDFLWAELPIILNSWEAFAPEVKKYNLGVILTGQPQKDAQKIIKFSKNKKLQAEIKNNIRKYKKNMSWQKGLEPVINYCKNAK